MTTPTVTATIQQGDELLTLPEIHTDNRDLVRWDRARATNRWPQLREAPFLWLTYISWAGYRRLGIYSGTYDEWDEVCVEITTDRDPADVDPTRTAAASDT